MKKLGESEVKDYLSKYGFTLLGPYKDSVSHILVRCPQNHEVKTVFSNFKSRSSRCAKCNYAQQAKTQKTPYDEVLAKAESIGVKILSTKAEYEAVYSKKPPIKCLCRCGLTEKTLHWCELVLDRGCHKCSKASQPTKHTIEHVREVAKSLGYTVVSTVYVHSKSVMRFKCKKHGEFETRFNDLDQGHGCPTCGGISSIPEKEIAEYVRSICPFDVKVNDRKILKGLELDVWVEKANFGIEYDGLYWHSEAVKSPGPSSNKEKIKRVRDAGVSFLAIFGDEWLNPIKRNIVKSMISSRLGLTPHKIFARKTEIREVGKELAKEFMNHNHLDGHVQFTKAFGLFYKNQLVMCLTLRTSSKHKIQEIARMATSTFCVVVGGASKLISSIKGPLMSYSNNRVGEGKVYQKLGFVEETLTHEPSYYYTDHKKRIWRAKCKKLPDLTLGSNEREQALNGAFSKHFGHSKPVYRIYDYGHKRWIRKS